MAHKQETITLLDVSQKPFLPVTIVLEDGGLETIQWLVDKVEEVLGKVGTGQPSTPSAGYNSRLKVRVTKLVVGDMEIKGHTWKERNVDHYRILDDLWCIQARRLPAKPPGETRTLTIAVESSPPRSLSVCSGLDSVGTISYSNGVIEFSDMSAERQTRREWSRSAPRWRRANPGLCLEGKCINGSCDANGKMVIMNMGFNMFKLPTDVYRCKCPLCKDLVQPVTCGFNNCRWKWAGTKQELPNPPSNHSNKKWQVADDAYHTFNPNRDGGGKAQWISLTLFAEDTRTPQMICKLCLTPGTIGIESFQCGCQMHTVCAKNFPKQPDQPTDTSEQLSTSCPECYMKNVVGKRMGISNFDKP